MTDSPIVLIADDLTARFTQLGPLVRGVAPGVDCRWASLAEVVAALREGRPPLDVSGLELPWERIGWILADTVDSDPMRDPLTMPFTGVEIALRVGFDHNAGRYERDEPPIVVTGYSTYADRSQFRVAWAVADAALVPFETLVDTAALDTLLHQPDDAWDLAVSPTDDDWHACGLSAPSEGLDLLKVTDAIWLALTEANRRKHRGSFWRLVATGDAGDPEVAKATYEWAKSLGPLLGPQPDGRPWTWRHLRVPLRSIAGYPL